MHPVLARKERLGAYLLAWGPVAAIAAYLVSLPGSLSLGESALLAVPLSVVYAFLCLSSWYACRSAPLTRGRLAATVGVHAAGAGIAAALWTLAAVTLASLLGTFPSLSRLSERVAPVVPILFVLGVLLYALSVAFHYLLLSLESSQAAERRVMESKVLAREAELEALKAQLNPHFLFNSLNSVSALTTTAPSRAREMTVLLSEFLRTSLSLGGKASIPLGEEVALARRFLAIEKVRFGSRLEVEEEVAPEAAAVPVPPLLLQPLVENAVRHGIGALVDGGRISIRARHQGGRVRIAVENPTSAEGSSERGAGLGLTNVRRRLAALYGREAELVVTPGEGTFLAEVVLPAEPPA